jgi:ABC-type uncharacterized transport system ATPase subunit
MEEARVSGDPRRSAETFSGGMLQRIITARELAETFDLVIVAEPGWGLDAASRVQLKRRLRRLAATGRSVLLLSTDVDELVALSDEIAILRDGEIAAKLSMDECANPLPTATALLTASISETIGAAMIGAEACDDR